MDLPAVLRTVDALREARDGEGFVLLATGVLDGILQVFAADEISLNDHHAAAGRLSTLELRPARAAREPRGAAATTPPVMLADDPYGDRQWSSAVTCTDGIGPDGLGHALAVPLPAPRGIARTLVFSRRRPFGEEDRSAAVLLQPHIADALRCQGRHAATPPRAC